MQEMTRRIKKTAKNSQISTLFDNRGNMQCCHVKNYWAKALFTLICFNPTLTRFALRLTRRERGVTKQTFSHWTLVQSLLTLT